MKNANFRKYRKKIKKHEEAKAFKKAQNQEFKEDLFDSPHSNEVSRKWQRQGDCYCLHRV